MIPVFHPIFSVIFKTESPGFNFDNQSDNQSIVNGIALNFTQEDPGTLLTHFQVSDIAKIDSLTICGILDDRDIKIINRMINLVYLDLTETFIKEGPSELKDSESFWNDYGRALNGEKKSRPTKENLIKRYGKKLGSILATSQSIDFDNDHSRMPLIAGLPKLVTIKMPRIASTMVYSSLSNCSVLKNIVWPEDLTYIENGCFKNSGIEELNFPSSLYNLAAKAASFGQSSTTFENCNKLKILNFSKCSKLDFESLSNNIRLVYFTERLTDLKEVWLPPFNLNRTLNIPGSEKSQVTYFIPKEIKYLEIEGANSKYSPILHFISPTPPGKVTMYGYKGKGQKLKVYIPKGSLNNYYMVMGLDGEVDFIEY